jgi:hypothetical protein
MPRQYPPTHPLTRLRAITAQGAGVILQNRTPENMTGAECTLNGKPATICGRLEKFATVAALDGSARAQFSWHACANVLDSGGRFVA